MSDDQVVEQPERQSSQEAKEESKPISAGGDVASLRIWPVLVVVLVMVLARNSGGLSKEPNFGLQMTVAFLPGLLAGVIMLWWLLLSRAKWKERLAGAFGIVLIGIATTLLQDKTFMGIGTFVFALPWGMGLFGMGAVLLRGRSPARLIAALLAGLMGFSYWTLIRIDEIHGDFRTVQSWRWEPSAEEKFLASLESRKSISDEERQALEDSSIEEVAWPAFRGPDRIGSITGVVLPEDWNANAPKEIWRNRVGPGWSSFSVAGDLILTQEQRGELEAVVCMLAEDGREVWVREDESRFWESVAGAGPRATPTIAGEFVYALGANGFLNCLELNSGELVWQRKLEEDAQRGPPTWGFSSSPLVTHGVVIVHAGGDGDKGVLAYDETSGELVWGCASGDHSYSSPQLSTVDGQECVLMLCNEGLTIIDPNDGRVLGKHEWLFDGYRVIQPLVFDDSKILLGTAFSTGTRCINASWDGEKFDMEEVWHARRMSPYFNDFVEHEGYLYGFDNSIFSCIDLKDGSLKWRGGRYGNGQVLLLPDEDQLLVISDKGDLVLVSASPEGLNEIAQTTIFEGRTWNHPVVVGKRLYLRNAEEAACFEFE